MRKGIGDKRCCEGYLENSSTKKADDFVMSTGKQYSVKVFVKTASKHFGFKIGGKEKG